MPEPSSGPTSALRVVARDAYGDWEAVYVNNVVAVYRLVFRHVGNRPDAEDLTEEVFLAALPRLRLPAAVHSVQAYLAATVKTLVADHWRRLWGKPISVNSIRRPRRTRGVNVPPSKG
jgi:DNA-directed RNA polymerase specialized sigma24 family protein